jgi:peptide/nickel transport system substrate-binding protein
MGPFARRLAPVAGAVLALCAGACSGPGVRGEADPARSRTVTIGSTVGLDGVNPLVSGGVRLSNEVLDQLFHSLLAEQTDWTEHPPSLVPALARSWELSPDGLQLTFHLRPDARWSDGAPVTAEDVRFTYEAQLAPEVAWPYAQSKRQIRAVEVLDARTVRFDFREPYPYSVIDVNDGRVLPSHAWKALPFDRWRVSEPWFQQHLVTSGPFRVGSWTSKSSDFVLVRDPDHRSPSAADPAPGAEPQREGGSGFDRVVFRVIPDSAALIERLLAGDLDFFEGLSPRDAERVRASNKLRLIVSDVRQYEYIGWNNRRPPFDDPEIRRALTLAIDRKSLVDTLMRGFASICAGPIPPGVWARDSDLEPWPYDPVEARAILARKGFRDSDGDGILERDGRPFRFTLTTNAGNRTRAEAAVLIRDQLRRVGIDAQPAVLEFQVEWERQLVGDFDAVIGGWGIPSTLDFRPEFHSSQIGNRGHNFVAYRNAEVDRLLDEVHAEPDLETARPQLVRFQRILHQEQPYTFLWEPKRLSAASRDIDGIVVDEISGLRTLDRWKRRPPAP